MNTFDFYVVKAFSSTKTPLKPVLAIAGGRIETRKTGYKTYGRNSFPVWEHSISLGYVNVAGKNKETIDAEIEAITEKFKGHNGVKILATYIARD